MPEDGGRDVKGAILWKRILNNGLHTAKWFADTADADALQYLIVTSTIIVAPTMNGDAQTAWRDMNGIALPFEKFWIEGSINIAGEESRRWGCLFDASRTEDGGFNIWCAGIDCSKTDPPDVTGTMAFRLDKDGKPVEHAFFCEVPQQIIAIVGDEETAKSGAAYPSLVACMALMILSCKNVSLTPNEAEPEQARRAIKRFGGAADSYRYHTLVVRPAGSGAHSRGQAIDVMPHHIRRGHFAEYGPEFGKGLLFGKYAGRFYVPQMVVGDKKHGVVEKDYVLITNNSTKEA